jgi:putative transposase
MTSFPSKLYYYKFQKYNTVLIKALQDLALKQPTYKFRKLFAYNKRQDNELAHKKVYRVYKLLKVNRKRKEKGQIQDV